MFSPIMRKPMNIAAAFAGIAVVAGNLVGAPALAQMSYFSIVNDSSEPIVTAYVAPSGMASSQQEVLSDPVHPGEIRNVPMELDASNCEYTVGVQFATGQVSEMSAINLCNTNTVVVQGTSITAHP